MRLEPSMWDALANISDREGKSIHELTTDIDNRRGETAMTSAVRVFVLAYFQALAKEMERRLTEGPAYPGISRLPGSPIIARDIMKDIFG